MPHGFGSGGGGGSDPILAKDMTQMYAELHVRQTRRHCVLAVL